MASPRSQVPSGSSRNSPSTARKAAALIPNAELHDDVVEKLADDRLRKEWDRQEWRNAEGRIAQIFAAFLLCAENVRQVA